MKGERWNVKVGMSEFNSDGMDGVFMCRDEDYEMAETIGLIIKTSHGEYKKVA